MPNREYADAARVNDCEGGAMSGQSSPVASTFRFRAERALVEERPGRYLAEGQIEAGTVGNGGRVWVHVPGAATPADVVEIRSDGNLVPDARAGQGVALVLRGGRALAGLTVGTVITDGPHYVEPKPPPKAGPAWEGFEGPEALEWLRTAPNGDNNAFA